MPFFLVCLRCGRGLLHPSWQGVSSARHNHTQSYDYLFNKLRGWPSFSFTSLLAFVLICKVCLSLNIY
ncbi:hypothetical protein HMPREF1991_01463 [Hoylesella loescheii DSM 19665 = JCM 12249 = ATCC 15930]|uniref:Uncharacterized protein n=1 Tax=Hoylesella loescheii DSM 19665 = JCM 12249 = ATCC 15930 TaxID=1122985 RepID=A0A069QHV9_HOYLO|nr:hypothetical protein HMPREF1991_01463 [Hoylesella loescheii DSM 19665 = JCM 12249 = ATCC 15930]